MDRRLQALIVISIITITGVVLVVNFAPPQPTDEQVLNFYVFGDSQGYQGGISQIITSANENNPDFIFHCGGGKCRRLAFIHDHDIRADAKFPAFAVRQVGK